MALGSGALGGRLGHDGGASIYKISALIKESPESSLIPSTMQEHRSLQPGRGASSNHAATLISDLQLSKL